MIQGIHGVGINLKHQHIHDLLATEKPAIDFLEFAPENWLTVGGWRRKSLNQLSEFYPFICHGLSLSIAGPRPLDKHYLQQLKHFLDRYQVALFSEHLSYCGDKQGFLYDLLPIPFTQEAVSYVVKRIKQVQETLETTIAIENISYYFSQTQEMDEWSFILAVLDEAQCQLLFDVNNLYVNSVNHHYDPYEILPRIPVDKIAYFHMAGHNDSDPTLLIDTHGAAVVQPVWQLLKASYQYFPQTPCLLERDHHIPPLSELLLEINQMRAMQQQHSMRRDHAS